MPRPLIKIHNAQTNEIIEREMTNDEYKTVQAQEALDAANEASKNTEAEAKATEKAALLERLGITESEAKLLLS